MVVDIDSIKIVNRIRKSYGDIQGLADDVKENGLINPPVVTPEFVLIAGERRVKACKLLGYQQIEVRVMTVKDFEHQLKLEISENESRKEFVLSERVEWARRLEQVERLKAKERQGARSDIQENFPECDKGQVRDKVALQAGFGSGKNYEKAKFIMDSADKETINQLDDGQISIHKAYQETVKRTRPTQAMIRSAVQYVEAVGKYPQLATLPQNTAIKRAREMDKAQAQADLSLSQPTTIDLINLSVDEIKNVIEQISAVKMKIPSKYNRRLSEMAQLINEMAQFLKFVLERGSSK